MTSPTLPQPLAPQLLSSDQALQIARVDAEKAYRDLTAYRVTLALESDGWHIDYELKDPDKNGGGAHYIIDAQTGQIILKKYEQ